ncbi:hypothetical protein N0O92_08275 [Alkalihalobacillus sp. MEB130]|uniref:hypothetical protein n=1 Tax=Alkalihalobacillus sp. MEB130 TaxID=2976704 RepID=UPI0028DDFAEB|nr:hypothetical protein [Alkalihalobacillus sp. MEB130]MDT8860228.1 hypothetical protein [Alkalihalobacillus sp. MEB130]
MDTSVNIIEIVMTILSWGVIGFFFYYLYQKQEAKPKIWKAFVATFVGLFTFSFNIPLFETILDVPILPLGVWILLWYASSREGAWEKYRRFAWLGFSANFIFIATTLLTVFIHHAVYPKSNLSTYIANIEEVAISQLHPSAEDVTLDQESLELHVSSFEKAPVTSMDWYNVMIDTEPHERVEQFPYQLSGTSSKWGSGIPTMIYVEKDGKGLLIDSSERQRYFRSDVTILKGGNDE